MENVCIYNRCSTEEESQKNALEVQAQESVEIANGFKDWLIVDHFIESQSGTSIKGRSKYQAMIDGIEAKRYTIVMIKSIDRLVRNTLDWYKFLDCITRNGVKLYIYMDNKFYSSDDALITGIKAMLAAEFSKELSKKIKNAHRRRQIKKSGLNFTMPLFGWDKVSRDVYIINEEEADAIREACDLAERGYGFGRISKYMYNKGIRGKTGRFISEAQWRKMIRSTRIYGTVILHQYEYDFETKKRIPIPEEEWVIIEGALPPIITKEHYDRLIKILDERAEKCVLKGIPSKIGESDLSAKIICGECGSTYHRRNGNYSDGKKTIWACSQFVNMGRIRPDNPDGCDNLLIRDDILKDLIIEAYRERFGISKDDSSIIDDTLRIIRKTFAGKDNGVRINKLRKEIDKIQKYKDKNFEKLMEGTVSDNDYKMYTQRYDEQLDKYSKELSTLEAEMRDIIDYEQRLLNIKNELKETDLIEEAANEDIFKKVEKVTVYLDGNVKIKFDKYKVLNIGTYGIGSNEDIDDLYTVCKKYVYVTAVDRRINERYEAIKEYVNNHDIINSRDIEKELDLKKTVVYVELKRLQDEGMIEFIKMVGGGFWRKVGSNAMKEGKRSLRSPDGIYDMIIDYIKEHGRATHTELAETFNITKENVNNKLYILKKRGDIYFVYDDAVGHWFIADKENINNNIKPMKVRIEEYMQMYKEASTKKVMDALNISRSTAKVRLRELKLAGKINYKKTGEVGGTWYWIEESENVCDDMSS